MKIQRSARLGEDTRARNHLAVRGGELVRLVHLVRLVSLVSGVAVRSFSTDLPPKEPNHSLRDSHLCHASVSLLWTSSIHY